MPDMKSLLAAGLDALGISAGERELERFERFYELLIEKNRVMNLTAITEEDAVAKLHFLDCAALLTAADFEGKSLIDVGTGAGFPGLPMKILLPSLEMTLFDSLRKRIDFLESAVSALGLEGVRCVHGRAEEAARLPEFRERFDFAVSRAVARLDMLCELCLPFVRPGGQFLAMKAAGSEEELDLTKPVAEKLGGEYMGTREYQIPGTDVLRLIYLFGKKSPTAGTYPRRYSKLRQIYRD